MKPTSIQRYKAIKWCNLSNYFPFFITDIEENFQNEKDPVYSIERNASHQLYSQWLRCSSDGCSGDSGPGRLGPCNTGSSGPRRGGDNQDCEEDCVLCI